MRSNSIHFLAVLAFALVAGCTAGQVGPAGGLTGGNPDGGPVVVPDGLIPSDRLTVWNPGLNAVGGIPSRTTIYKTLSPSGGDDTSAIQNALDSCPENQVVQLSAGNFTVSGQGLEITKSNVVLRGSGPTQTILSKTGQNFPVVIIGQRFYSYTAAVNLTADAPAGATIVTVARDPGFKVGEIVFIDQVSDETRSDTTAPLRRVYWGVNATDPNGQERGWFCEQNRPLGQTLEITAISGTQISFSTPMHVPFETVLQAHIVRLSDGSGAQVDAVKYSGIEDLAVVNGDGGDGGGNIHLFATAYSWVKNVESSGSLGHSCNLDGTFRCEVRDSYFHSTRDPNPGGNGYGIGINQYASDNLYENNIVWNFNKVTVARASGGGNVFGYNYFQDGYGEGYPDYIEDGAGSSHYTGAHSELFEGNAGFNFDIEVYWGNATYGMVYRNNWTGLRRSASPLQLNDTDNRRAVGLQTGAWWFTFVGNILGFPNMPLRSGQTRFIEQADVNNLNDDSAVPMWLLGYEEGNFPDQADALVVSRTYRHGNFDYASNALRWDPANAIHDMPPSLYLTGKPAFFGSNPWPWIDPTGTTDAARIHVLPARARFDAIHGAGVGQ